MTTTIGGSYPAVNSDSDATINGLTVGKGAGAGSQNTAIGFSAMPSSSVGFNVAVGYQAGLGITTGEGNSALGRGVMAAGTVTGISNTGAGNFALNVITTGAANSAFGNGSASALTTGSFNTALGDSALRFNTTASNNTAVGYQAGYANTTGTQNTFLGGGAGNAVTTGSYNTALGYATLQSLTGNSFNVAVGRATLNVTTGQLNTAIGYASGSLITSGSKNTIIGAYDGNQGGLDIRTASNYIVLSDGDGNPRAVCNNAGGWTFGNGGTASGYMGNIIINGSSANGYQSAITGQSNGTNSYTIGSYGYLFGGANTFFTCQNTSGGVYLNGASATAWTSASDERLKENLEPITDALNKVSTLRTVIGNYKFDEEKVRKPFLIAQDVQAILPEAVTSSRQSKEDDTEYLGIAYTETIPLLVAAIKELKAEFDAYKATHP